MYIIVNKETVFDILMDLSHFLFTALLKFEYYENTKILLVTIYIFLSLKYF